jgi:hypothetical protein
MDVFTTDLFLTPCLKLIHFIKKSFSDVLIMHAFTTDVLTAACTNMKAQYDRFTSLQTVVNENGFLFHNVTTMDVLATDFCVPAGRV